VPLQPWKRSPLENVRAHSVRPFPPLGLKGDSSEELQGLLNQRSHFGQLDCLQELLQALNACCIVPHKSHIFGLVTVSTTCVPYENVC
jgi:hypothetical protein